MSYQFRGYVVSDEMLESLQAYAEHGRPVGHFLTAVLANDLMDACGRADDDNLPNLPAFAAWVYQEAPHESHGSREKVKAWITKHLRASEEEPEVWQCQSCGKEFDQKTFSHSRAEPDSRGNPIEVQCGPISKRSPLRHADEMIHDTDPQASAE